MQVHSVRLKVASSHVNVISYNFVERPLTALHLVKERVLVNFTSKNNIISGQFSIIGKTSTKGEG